MRVQSKGEEDKGVKVVVKDQQIKWPLDKVKSKTVGKELHVEVNEDCLYCKRSFVKRMISPIVSLASLQNLRESEELGLCQKLKGTF